MFAPPPKFSAPRIENLHAGLFELDNIPRHNREAMMGGGGRDHQVGLRECVAGFPALLHQQAPL